MRQSSTGIGRPMGTSPRALADSIHGSELEPASSRDAVGVSGNSVVGASGLRAQSSRGGVVNGGGRRGESLVRWMNRLTTLTSSNPPVTKAIIKTSAAVPRTEGAGRAASKAHPQCHTSVTYRLPTETTRTPPPCGPIPPVAASPYHRISVRGSKRVRSSNWRSSSRLSSSIRGGKTMETSR